MVRENKFLYRDTLSVAAHFHTGEATHWSQRTNRKPREGRETSESKSGKILVDDAWICFLKHMFLLPLGNLDNFLIVFFAGSPQEKDKERLEFEKSETVNLLTRQLEAKVQHGNILSLKIVNSYKYCESSLLLFLKRA